MSDPAANPRLLVVDDDSDLSGLIAGFLRDHHLDVDTAGDAAGMDAAMARAKYDCVVLDLMMPGEDGLSILRRLRARDRTPVIMLSAMGEDVDRIVGLEVGADDYLAKPCNPRELLARVRALLRRSGERADAAAPGTPRRRFGDWQIDLVERVLHRANYPQVPLTDAEFRILTAFLDRAQRVLSRDTLIELAKGSDADVFDRAIDVTISRLRKKLGPGDPIRTIRNEGYMFALKPEEGMTDVAARKRFRSLPIFWQTLVLLLGGLVVAQIVSILLIVYLPQPRPDFYTMSEIAESMVGDPGANPAFHVEHLADPPNPETGMVQSGLLTARLARGLALPEANIRLFFLPDQAEIFPFNRARSIAQGAVPVRHGQPYFFNSVEAAIRLPDGRWRVVHTPPRPIISSWQQKTFLWFGISALAMLPFAWVFARALTRPIRNFARAVERLDHDRDAPPVPDEGPTELRLAADALNTMRDNLHAYLRERTAMIGAIAHDLRTPLARIAFRIERAPEDLREPMRHDLEQMREMIATTIGFVRDGAGVSERHPVDLAGLAARLAEQARDCGSAVAATRLEAVTVEGDRSALERLIQNLIDNAVKYGGGAELSVEQHDATARLCVRDDGPGIPEAELERMFEPFARADPSRSRSTGGIGLGLAIARGIAVAHGGSIVAANRSGGGLAVTVELPLAA